MEELRSKIIELRKRFTTVNLRNKDAGRDKILLEEAHEMMRKHENKEEAYTIWTNQMTGIYDD